MRKEIENVSSICRYAIDVSFRMVPETNFSGSMVEMFLVGTQLLCGGIMLARCCISFIGSLR